MSRKTSASRAASSLGKAKTRPGCSVTKRRSSPAAGCVKLVRPRKSRCSKARATVKGRNGGALVAGEGDVVVGVEVGDGVLDSVGGGVGGWLAVVVGVLESIGSGVGVGVSAVVGLGVSAAADVGVGDASAATEGSAVSEPHEATTTASSKAARTKTAPTEIFTCGPSEDGGPGVGGHGVLPCRNPPPLETYAQPGRRDTTGKGAHKGRPYGEKRPAGALC